MSSATSEYSGRHVYALFGAIGERYRYATRMARDLRARVQSLDSERDQWMRAFAEPSMSARARLELKEIETLRPRVERSAIEWAERARVLELIVGSCVVEASLHPSRRGWLEEPEDPQQAAVLVPPQPPLWPDGGPDVRAPDAQGMSGNAADGPGVVCSHPEASPT